MGNKNGKTMGEIITFPKVPKAKVTKEVKEVLQEQAKMKRIETNLNLLLGSNHNWDLYTFTTDDLHMLSLYGETMKFDPKVASRLISKLAEFIARLSRTLQDMEEPFNG